MTNEPNTGWRLEDDVSNEERTRGVSFVDEARLAGLADMEILAAILDEFEVRIAGLIVAAERYLLAQTAQRENALREAIARAKGEES